ncbi:hypothetical protein MTO96_027920 [Rhipicephalus appendiculatus]
MYAKPCTAILTIFAALLSGRDAFLDDNPALGDYQDDSKCLEWKEPWYVIYRNYELDPLYGDSTHCANATVVATDPDEPAFWTKEQGETTKFLKDTLLSSPGYTTKNLVHVQSARPGKQPSKRPEIDLYMSAVFVDCNSCKVFRHHYIDGGAGCTLWKPESKINQRDECCEFIYDLLCGTSPKYHISDNCFQSS